MKKLDNEELKEYSNEQTIQVLAWQTQRDAIFYLEFLKALSFFGVKEDLLSRAKDVALMNTQKRLSSIQEKS
jgi:hypothetical protein